MGFPEFGADFQDLLNRVPIGRTHQFARYRQGGDPQEWQQAGGYSYTDINGFIQVGSREWVGGAATSGSLAFALPVSYPFSPLLWVQVARTTPLTQQVTTYANSDGAQIELAWWSANNLTSIWFHWLAYGPGSL